jgi:hypothetical protein
MLDVSYESDSSSSNIEVNNITVDGVYVGPNIYTILVHFDPEDEGNMFLQNFPWRS